MNSIKEHPFFYNFENYLNNTEDKKIFQNPPIKQKKSLTDSIKNLFNKTPNPFKEETIDFVKFFLEEKINNKLNRATQNGKELLPRLLRNCKVKETGLDSIETVKKVLQTIQKLEFAGQAPQFNEERPEMIPGEHADNFIKYLFSDQPLSLQLIDLQFIKALLFVKNETLLKNVRQGLESYLEKLAIDLNKPEFQGRNEQKLGEFLIGNILALYPFFEPEDQSIIQIPQKIENIWKAVPYQLHLLQMTPSWKGDPYYACGFEPLSEGQPHLAFMGTPPPTTKGVAHAEFTDLIPGFSVGQTIYEEGKEKIEAWIEKTYQKSHKKINVYGQSLGGSLSLILIANKPDHIKKVFAYNPPSLWKPLLNKYQNAVASFTEKERPNVNIFCQENDPIYPLGAGWDPKWNIYQVLPEKSPNPYEAHIRAFLSHKVAVLKMTAEDIQTHNKSIARRIYNLAAEILRIPLFAIKGTALGIQILKHNVSRLFQKIYHATALFLTRKDGRLTRESKILNRF